MNIIEATRAILADFKPLSDIKIDFSEAAPQSFSLSPVGDFLISESITGTQKRCHSFLFYAVFSSLNDYERLANSSVIYDLQMWLKSQKNSAIDGGKITKITAENGMLIEVPDENQLSGYRYQLQINTEYEVQNGISEF